MTGQDYDIVWFNTVDDFTILTNAIVEDLEYNIKDDVISGAYYNGNLEVALNKKDEVKQFFDNTFGSDVSIATVSISCPMYRLTIKALPGDLVHDSYCDEYVVHFYPVGDNEPDFSLLNIGEAIDVPEYLI